MLKIILVMLAFCIGIVVGNRLLWWHLSKLWKRNPYAFKAIVDGVIALREEKAAKEKIS